MPPPDIVGGRFFYNCSFVLICKILPFNNCLIKNDSEQEEYDFHISIVLVYSFSIV